MKYIERTEQSIQKAIAEKQAYEEALQNALNHKIILNETEIKELINNLATWSAQKVYKDISGYYPIGDFNREEMNEAIKWALKRFELDCITKYHNGKGTKVMPDGYLDTTANYRNFGFDQTSVIGGYIQEYFLRVKTNSIRLEDQVNNALNTVSQETFKTPDEERKALIEALQAHFYNTQLATKFKAFVTGEQDLEHAIKYAIARFEAPDIGNVITDNGKARFAVPEPKPQTHINNFTLTAKNLLDSFKGNGLYPNLEELLEEYMTNVATREDFKPKAPTGFHM